MTSPHVFYTGPAFNGLPPYGAVGATLTAAGSLAPSLLAPPDEWYQLPTDPAALTTDLTVSPDGRVTGLIAPYGMEHRGRPGVKSDIVRGDDFRHFHTGKVTTASGQTVRVGSLTIGGGHADGTGDIKAAAEHYDDVATAWSTVRAYDTPKGVFVAGAVAPGTTPEMLYKVNQCPPSGDWRWDRNTNRYHLVACCQVVVPGLPVLQPAQLAASGALTDATGTPLALVAAASDWTVTADATDMPEPDVTVDPEEAAEDLDTDLRLTALELKVAMLLQAMTSMQASAVAEEVAQIRSAQADRIRADIARLKTEQ